MVNTHLLRERLTGFYLPPNPGVEQIDVVKKTRQTIAHTLGRLKQGDTGALYLHRPEDLDQFIAVPNNLIFVSFPRTGSHWVRLLMEQYFSQPLLPRTFYMFDQDDYLLYHTHDMDLKTRGDNVIYLHRNPVSTIYSQMRFYSQDFSDVDTTKGWANLYARHLDKWVITTSPIQKKTVITYENLHADIAQEFSKICQHLGQELDSDLLETVSLSVSKETTNKKTQHDQRVVQISTKYEDNRETFKKNMSQVIIDELDSVNSELRSLFSSSITFSL